MPLAGLTILDSLVLENNELADVSSLVNLQDLRFIDLSDNPVEDLSPLVNLEKLGELRLSRISVDEGTCPLAGARVCQERDGDELNVYCDC